MNTISLKTFSSIIATASLAGAFCVETYISSGWDHFLSDSESHQSYPAKAKQSGADDQLKSLINQHLNCDINANKKARLASRTRSRISLWLSPYRQFPEVPLEGSSRGKGDYEYFSYLADGECGRIASNYGAFKKSPADQHFSKASEQGIGAELQLAQQLGYDIFALDTKKIWLTPTDRDLCRKRRESCKETSDGFMVIDLKAGTRSAEQPNFLLNSVRMGVGMTLGESIEAHSLTAARSSQWYAWESPEPEAVFRWSNGTKNPSRSIELLTPAVGEESPANLRTHIVANPSVKTLLVELICTQGRQKEARLSIQTTKDISEVVNTCLPKAIKVLQAIDKNGMAMSIQAPALAKDDSRQTFFGIMYNVN